MPGNGTMSIGCRRRWLQAAALVMSASASVHGQQNGGRELITFEDTATYWQSGVAVSRLYNQYARRGIIFNGAYVVDVPRRFRTSAPGTPTRAIMRCIDASCTDSAFDLRFTRPQAFVKALAGLTVRGAAPVTVLVEAFDRDGGMVETRRVSISATLGSSGPTVLQVGVKSNRIMRVVISGPSRASIALDDIEFQSFTSAAPDPAIRADSIRRADSTRRADSIKAAVARDESLRIATQRAAIQARKDSLFAESVRAAAEADSIRRDSIAKVEAARVIAAAAAKTQTDRQRIARADAARKALTKALFTAVDSAADSAVIQTRRESARRDLERRKMIEAMEFLLALVLLVAIAWVGWNAWKQPPPPPQPQPPLPLPDLRVFLATPGLEYQRVEYREARSLDLDLTLSVTQTTPYFEDDS